MNGKKQEQEKGEEREIGILLSYPLSGPHVHPDWTVS